MTLIPNAIVRRTTQFATSSATPVDVDSLASTNFIPGHKYLILVQYQWAGASTANEYGMQVAHGGVAFPGSVGVVEPSSTATHNAYNYFTVWEAVASEAIAVQAFANDGNDIDVELGTLLIIDLDEFTEDTDYFFDEVEADTTLSNTMSSTNNASVTFTPGVADEDYLVIAQASLDSAVNTSNMNTQLRRSGESAEIFPTYSQEGEDVTEDLLPNLMVRAVTPGAVSNTFQTESNQNGGGPFGTRTYSAVFILRLNAFLSHGLSFTNGSVTLDTNFDLPTSTNVATNAHTRTVLASDLLILGGFSLNPDENEGDQPIKARMQFDNTDEPATQTTKDYSQLDGWDAEDKLAWKLADILSGETLASHTLDVDASGNSGTPQQTVGNRYAIQLELAQLVVTDETFDVDAFILETIDNDFDVDAFVLLETDHIFTVDSFLRLQTDLNYTADAIVINREELAFIVDAQVALLDQETDFTVDGLIEETFDDAFTVDSFLRQVFNNTSLVDAFVEQETDLDFTVDANVQAETSSNYSVDAYVQELDKEFGLTLDAIVLLTDESEPTVDAVVVDRFTDTSSTDAILIVRKEDNFQVDANIAQIIPVPSLVDAFVQQETDNDYTVDAFVLGEMDLNFTLDSFVLTADLQIWNNDAFLRELDKEFGFNLDSLLSLTRQIQWTQDAILSSRLPGPFTVDANVIAEDQENDFSVDGVLSEAGTLGFTLDAIISSRLPQVFTLDATISEATPHTFSLDAILSALLEFSVDANIEGSKGGAFQVDSIISSRLPEEFTVDANIVGGVGLNFTVDANVLGATDLQFTVDASISQGSQVDFTVDANIAVPINHNFAVDGVVKAFDTNFLWEADAIISAPGFFFWTVDTELESTYDNNFAVDALIPGETTFPFNLDAVVVAQPTFDFSVDSILGGPGLHFFSVDCIIDLNLSCAFPDEDLANDGNWVVEPLWSKINSFRCDGVDFVSRDGHPDSDESFEVGLDPLADPGVSNGHFITINARTDKPNDGYKVRGQLFQDGFTLIAESPYFTLESAFKRFNYQLSALEADAITNYMTLSVVVQTEQFGTLQNGFAIDGVIV